MSMSRVSTSRSRHHDSFCGRRTATANDSPAEQSMSPLFSPVTQSLRPRAVSFFSPPKEGDALSTVMFREDSPSTARSRARSLNSSSIMTVTTAPPEVFFSPVSHVSSIRSMSPEAAAISTTSNLSRTATSSSIQRNMKKMGMERFSQAHISKCQSSRELEQTIADLQSQGHYPLLVRAAQKRLYQVQQYSACPLIEEEDDSIDMMEARISPKSAATSLVYSYDEERDAVDSVVSSPFKKVTHSSSIMQSRKANHETELHQTIEQLNQRIVQLNETLRQEKLDYECNLSQIQQSKQACVQHAQTLQQKLAATHQTAEKMTEQLKELQETNRTIAQQLEAERAAHNAHQQKAHRIETDLCRKIQELLQQIKVLQDSGGKVEELNHLLKSARKNFETIQRERNEIITTLLKAMGHDVSGVLKMTLQDRESVVKTFVGQTANRSEASRTAIQTMQEALMNSEAKCKKVSESYRTEHARLQSVLADQQRLEQENKRLANQVRELTEELQQSREDTDRLLARAREENQKEWMKKENMFKNTIRILQKQLRAEKKKEKVSTEIVSMEATNSRTLQPVVRVGNTVIRPIVTNKPALSSRDHHSNKPSGAIVSAAAKKQSHADKPVPPPPPPPLESIENKENGCKVQPGSKPTSLKGVLKPKRVLGNSTSRANGQGPAPAKIKAFVRRSQKDANTSSGAKTPAKTRAEFVRANGGLRVLQAKTRALTYLSPN